VLKSNREGAKVTIARGYCDIQLSGRSEGIAAGMAALLITLLTVSYQAIKAAVANLVKSLRTE
jgi:hypothetical protein